jgi:hypothetical protein
MARADTEEEGLMGLHDQQNNRNTVVRKITTSEAAVSLLSSYFSRRFASGW